MIIQLYKIDEDEKSSDSRGQDWLTILSLSVSARGESANLQWLLESAARCSGDCLFQALLDEAICI